MSSSLSINILDIKESYECYSNSKLLVKLEEMKTKWIISSSDSTMIEYINLGYNNLCLDEKIINMQILDKQYKKCIYEVVYLHYLFVKRGLIVDNTSEHLLHFNKIFEVLYYIERLFRSGLRLKMTIDPEYESTMNDDIGLFRFKPMDVSKHTPYQNVILFLLALIYERGYKRYNGCIYDKIYNDNEVFTYSWKKLMDIKAFIYENTKKEMIFEQWSNLTADKSNVKCITDHLTNCIDPQFPDLIKNRKVYSFKNGVYIIKKKLENIDYFYKYGTDPKLSPNTVSVKYFDINFDEDIYSTNFYAWYDIDTPNFQRILDYQYVDEVDYISICRWAYILLGRLLYNIGEMDDWQVIPYFIGQAGTGKSTILTEIVNHFYEKCDVGVLSNNIENLFGLGALKDKYVLIAPEVKNDFKLSQTDFQSMISGEDISVALKHKNAETIKWTIPLVCSGNETPGFTDNSGSISRRLILFYFRKKVKEKDSDPLMKQKLQGELPRIILKCNRAYLEAIEKYGDKNIWNT